MKESKRIQLSALLMAMLLIGMVFVPAIGAQVADGTRISKDRRNTI